MVSEILLIIWMITFVIALLLFFVSKIQKDLKRAKIIWIISLCFHGITVITSIGLVIVLFLN